MNGDFKGDFTRDTFYSLNHYSRVLMQQGRVQLDADWNEQVDILLYYLRTLTVDLVGPRAVRGAGFMVGKADQSGQTAQAVPQSNPRRGAKPKTNTASSSSSTIKIGSGHYYIDGILVENDQDFSPPKDLFSSFDTQSGPKNPAFLVYLDVWERQVTYIENKYIRESALGALGPDTATRASVVWQVKVLNTMFDGSPIPSPIPTPEGTPTQFTDQLDADWVSKWIPVIESPYRGQLKAKAQEVSKQNTTLCILSPEARFRGAENQLYRVEIHQAGTTGGTGGAGGATFKWSRENGSAVFPISNLAGKVVTLDTLGRDKRFGLKPDDWVEVVDNDYYQQESPNPLLQVDTVDIANMQVLLKKAPGSSIGQDMTKYPFLRRWDQNGAEELDGAEVNVDENGIAVVESADGTNWFTLENNVQIQFQAHPGTPNSYRPGDYWLIPARIATGNVEWPLDNLVPPLPVAQAPHGVEHHYAPLAFVAFTGDTIGQICDLRRTLIQLWAGPAGCPSLTT